MHERWTEHRVLAVLYSYRDIAEVLYEGSGAVSRYEETLWTGHGEPYVFRLARDKADIELAIRQLPWPRLVPAALYWLAGIGQEDIAVLLRRDRTRVSRWLEVAERDIVNWLVHGKPPQPPGPRAPVHPFWWVPIVVDFLCSGRPLLQEFACSLLEKILVASAHYAGKMHH